MICGVRKNTIGPATLNRLVQLLRMLVSDSRVKLCPDSIVLFASVLSNTFFRQSAIVKTQANPIFKPICKPSVLVSYQMMFVVLSQYKTEKLFYCTILPLIYSFTCIVPI